MKPTPEELKLAEEMLADGHQDAWERGRLGRDAKHTKRLTDEDVQRYLGEKKGTSIRLPDDLIADLRSLAERKGLAYQAYLRMVLIEHVRAQRSA